MELVILDVVGFEMNVPTSLRFLEFMLGELGLAECEETR